MTARPVVRPAPKEIPFRLRPSYILSLSSFPLSIGIMYLLLRANHLAPVLPLRVFPRHASPALPL
jgi:hypothetical protein